MHLVLLAVLISQAASTGSRLPPVPNDVPGSHWARAAVADVVSRGVMTAPGGKFRGAQLVTRRELAITLAALARSLLAGRWPKDSAIPLRPSGGFAQSPSGPVTRYTLAAVISKVARYVAAGLPADRHKVFYGSLIFPSRPKILVPKSDPAYSAVAYLVDGRMAFPPSIVLKPGPQPVTGREVSQALVIMIAGLTDRLTDEPQNREDLGPPPSKRK
ncbi:MAG: S-layer homology domain-containing protein [Chthonomonadales bacterium]